MSNLLGDLISRGEGGYNSFNRGNAGDAGGQTIDFSQMTLGQVQAEQHLGRNDPNRLFAVGKYQIIPDTMDDAVKRLKLDPDQKFTPALQERIFADYLIAGKRPAIEAYIKGEPGATLHAAQKAACQEWASVADPDTGKSYAPYLTHGNNHSSITSEQVAGALNTMRAEYQADIAKGMKPEEAWKAVTNSGPNHDQTKNTPTQASHRAAHGHTAENLLTEGTHSPGVSELQAHLAKLGYKDGHGHALKADGAFGIDTRHAVERFQHDHHLTVDGIAGPKTLEAIHHAQAKHAAPSLADPKNPDHALYEQARVAVHHLDASMGRTSDKQSDQLAASLAVAAKRERMTAIDTVVLSEDGSRAFAVQGRPDSPQRQIAHVPTAEAVNTPIDKSSAAAHAVNQQQAQQQPTQPSITAQAQSAPAIAL